jgi:predicted membrane protein (TIGR00267 family)
MSRVDQARKGYLNRDLKTIAAAHELNRIHRSIHHKEDHKSSFNLPEIILGGQDGIVNVLGVILGVAVATVSSKIVLVAGLAATFAESVSMAAVAYTSRLAEADYYQSELERERYEIDKFPQGEKEEIKALYENYGFKGKVLEEIIERITSDKETWLRVMMEQELKLEKVDQKEALPTALVVGLSALVGSFIPLLPFFFFPVKIAIVVSLIVSSLTLFAVGYYKARQTLGRQLLKQGIEMAVIGMASAAVGYLIGSLFKI